MTRNRDHTGVKTSDINRAANALRKAGNTREAKRLERNLPADKPKGDKR